MSDSTLVGPWVRRFLLEHLVAERNLAENTRRSYRDTLCLALPFIARRLRKAIDRLVITDVSVKQIQAFLSDLEEKRRCGISTRNQRLAAIRSLASFIALKSPEHIEWCGEIKAIPFKKAGRGLIGYLEKDEMDALLAAPDECTALGQRDRALLLYLYNTGARADEVAQGRVDDLEIGLTPERDQSSVVIRGKGNKLRRCPLWPRTVNAVLPLISDRAATEPIFLNRRGQPLTRFGIHSMVKQYAAVVAHTLPSVGRKRVSPHTIRHTTATHLLRAGVDINTIRAWLGHVSLQTTNVYAEVDLEMKARALASCEIEPEVKTPWKQDAALMEFLRNL